MKIKSHFTFTKKQRNGIFLLLAIIITLQGVHYSVDFSSDMVKINPEKLAFFKQEMDSLYILESENRKPRIYPFNPNFITDYKGYTLGMTSIQIDRLLQFRKQNKWINSTKEFQEVTQVSDSLLKTIAPYFKFPDWITNKKSKKRSSFNTSTSIKGTKTFDQKVDLNAATANQLQGIYGIGKVYSKRIIAYRNKHQGFIADVQLKEVYGLSEELINRIKKEFTVKTPKQVRKLNINTVTRDQLVQVPYIDYEVAHFVIEHRTLHEGFKSLNELTKVKAFPVHKIEIIKLYLTLD